MILSPSASGALALAGGYLMGSISFGMIVTRLAGAGDLRAIGSGNIGATNVLRTGRKSLAALTLIGDIGKGAAAVLLAQWLLGPLAAILAGGGALLGHLFPVWLGFRGGKGVAVFFGILFALAWPAGLAAGVVWIIVAAALRFSSLASLAAAACAPLLVWFVVRHVDARVCLTLVLAALIFVRHHANIGRLVRREEPRIGGAGASAPLPGSHR